MPRNLKMTGERAVPDDIRTPIEYIQMLRHYFAYECARQLVKPTDEALEVGSGEGYGAGILAQSVSKIVGLDVDSQVVEYSSARYGSEKCSFLLYDGQTIPFEQDSFDAVISFQVIEHIENDVAFVAELARMLKQGGKLLLTTPNKATRLKPGQRPWNRFHVREYHAEELAQLLKRYFGQVKVYGISATEEIHRIEASRIKQGPLLSLALKLNARKLVPAAADPIIARVIGRIRSNKVGLKGEDLPKRFKLEDFRLEENLVDKSLDLFAVAIKG